MKTITSTFTNEIEIKNSRFICYLIPLEDTNIDSYLDEIKTTHPKATHYCYAYVFDQEKRTSDDNEPSGTAGQPILNVLEKEELNHILAVVVRYFGGIKLGAGGLVRAYTKSVTETLKYTNTIELVEGYKIQINFTYEEENNISYLLQSSKIITKEYLEIITYICLVDKNILDKLERYKPKILEECYIEKLN